MKIHVQVTNLCRRPVPRGHIKVLVTRLFGKFKGHPKLRQSLPKKPSDERSGNRAPNLEIAFVGTKKGRELNKRFRKRDYATDILSFEPSNRGSGLGELVLCRPVLVRQAREHGLSFKEELDYLLIHGFLHLLGYDHERSRDEEKRMMRLQDALFEELSGG